MGEEWQEVAGKAPAMEEAMETVETDIVVIVEVVVWLEVVEKMAME